MGKKDVNQEHYQVKEAKKKRSTKLCYTKWGASSDERSAECGASESERMKLFVWKGFLKTWSREGNLLFFVG